VTPFDFDRRISSATVVFASASAFFSPAGADAIVDAPQVPDGYDARLELDVEAKAARERLNASTHPSRAERETTTTVVFLAAGALLVLGLATTLLRRRRP
jgi:hypothetical protein